MPGIRLILRRPWPEPYASCKSATSHHAHLWTAAVGDGQHDSRALGHGTRSEGGVHPRTSTFLPDQLNQAIYKTQFEVAYADTELNVRDALSHLVTGEATLSRFLAPEMERIVETRCA